MTQLTSFTVLGLMSGTSLDGTDLALCTFSKLNNSWNFDLLDAITIPYPTEWKETLNQLIHGSAYDLAFTHAALGRYYGGIISEFLTNKSVAIDFIGSHGHTIFHQPHQGFTCQIGDGAQIAGLTGIDTYCDFRSKDIALGGQGAPLVPIGDELLFKDFAACLNLGGIANISYQTNEGRKAFDICPVNMALNLIAETQGKSYDENGALASKGKVNLELLDKLNNLDFYNLSGPKSLGKEWFDSNFLPLLEIEKITTEIQAADISRTIVEHIAIQLSNSFGKIKNKGSILITGGGAFHQFLVKTIAVESKRQIHLPSDTIINFKEAIVFAFLATLNHVNSINIINSATGALRDSIGGAFYKGK